MKHKARGDYIVWIAVLVIILIIILCIIFKDTLNNAIGNSNTVETQENIIERFMEGQVAK